MKLNFKTLCSFGTLVLTMNVSAMDHFIDDHTDRDKSSSMVSIPNSSPALEFSKNEGKGKAKEYAEEYFRIAPKIERNSRNFEREESASLCNDSDLAGNNFYGQIAADEAFARRLLEQEEKELNLSIKTHTESGQALANNFSFEKDITKK